MTSKYDVNGVDLDSIFAPYTSGTQPAATGYTVDGVDLNTRYAPLSAGSAALPTKYVISSGADLNTLFAAANTTTVTVGTQPGNVSGSAAAGDPSGTVTSNTTTCAGSGGTGSYSYKWTIASGSATLTAPNSATTGVTGTVDANSTSTGTMYCTISDGISSAQTNTVDWSLQNTSLPVSISTQPGNVSGSAAAGDPTGTVTSNTTTVVAANGTGSYTYQWYIASGSGVSFTAGTSATTGVTGSVDANSTSSGTMYCTVTDSSGSTVNSNTVDWSLQNTTIPVSISTQPSNVSGSVAAGNPSGTVTSGTTSVTAANGYGSYSYQWKLASGSGVSFTTPTSASTAVTGTVNASSTNSGTMYCVVTDSSGGTVNSNTVDWSLQNTSPTFTSAQYTYSSGSGLQTVPAGAGNVVIELWGVGGPGADGTGTGTSKQYGAGGQAGGYCRSSYSCSGGQTLNYALDSTFEQASTVTSGTLAITTMTAFGGGQGSGTGYGTASGGNAANVTGAVGGPGGSVPSDGAGGAGTVGVYEGAEGGGGNGGYGAGVAGSPGQSPFVSFYFTA